MLRRFAEATARQTNAGQTNAQQADDRGFRHGGRFNYLVQSADGHVVKSKDIALAGGSLEKAYPIWNTYD